MRDESNIATISIAVMIIAALVFAVSVVVLTRSDLNLSSDNTLIGDDLSMESECGQALSRAVTALSAARMEEASTALGLVESLSCDKPYIIRAAELHGEMGNYHQVLNLLSPLMTERVPDVKVISIFISNLINCGMRDSATIIMRSMLPPRIEDGQIVRMLAWTALELELNDLAVSLFTDALEHDQEDPELWRALSQVMLRSGDPRGAERAAGEAIRLDPESIDAHIAHAWAAEAMNDTLQAVQSFRKALALSPGDQHTLFEFGRYYHRSGRVEKALDFLKKGTTDPDCPYTWLLLRGRAEVRAGRFDEARQTFLVADAKTGRDHHALLELARVERRIGNIDEARRRTQQALREFPEESEIRVFLSTMPAATP